MTSKAAETIAFVVIVALTMAVSCEDKRGLTLWDALILSLAPEYQEAP